MAAALEAKKKGLDDILIIERERELGGILNQCIHSGFGLHLFSEELSGPEYAGRFVRMIRESGVEYSLDSMVLSLSPDRIVTYISPKGLVKVKADSVVLAMGCRERTRGALGIPGTRPAGIFSAGTAQYYINIKGYLPGRRVVILGSGDIGLIMARRMTLEGAKVECVCEIMSYSGGLARNIVQCLEDFDIPLYYSHTVVKIEGRDRVSGVVIAQVDGARKPIPGTERHIECDTLLLSVGLIPENELSEGAGIVLDSVTGGAMVDSDMMTSIPGVFACGNALHVHDLVDFVTMEAYRAGAQAAQYVKNQGERDSDGTLRVTATGGVRYAVPQLISKSNVKAGDQMFFRVKDKYRDAEVRLVVDGETIKAIKKRRLAPGEMESVKLDETAAQRIRRASSVELNVYTGVKG